MVVPAPEKVQYEAGRLLLALSSRLPNNLLRQINAFSNLMSSLYSLSVPLPVLVQEKLFQSVSLLLLPTTSPPEPNIRSTYTAFLQPFTDSLVQGGQRLAASPSLDPATLNTIRRAARLLHSLCDLYGPSAKRTTTILFTAIEPCLTHIAPLLSCCLAQVRYHFLL